MDEDFVQIYLNKMAGRVNELQQENILLKSQLEHANMQLQKKDELLTQEVLPSESAEKIIEQDSPPKRRESLADRIRREQQGE